jgi:oxygen-independent coproporphyrinogen-3 oxidase
MLKLDARGDPRSAYLHVPFCRHRCGYCNFTLVAGRDDLIEDYLRALEIELSWLEMPRPVETLFLGGGTPTHLPPRELERLLSLAKKWFPAANCRAGQAGSASADPPGWTLVSVGSALAEASLTHPAYEFSIEANPIDLEAERTEVLAAAGVTRVSLGVQSFDDKKLAVLERDHRRREIESAYAAARSFAHSVSLDLIFAAPGESLDHWRRDLESAIALAPDHVSTYGLTFEKGTSFWTRRHRSELPQAAEDLEAQMYELAIDTLTAAGYEHYEVSNFARTGHKCRHNEVYWTGGSYFAAGPGASRHIAGRRETNHKSTTTYIRRVLAGQSPVAESEELSPEDRARERLVFGLRRLEGISLADFAHDTGFDIDTLGGQSLTRFVEQGLLDRSQTRLRLTRKGLLVSDALWPELIRE